MVRVGDRLRFPMQRNGNGCLDAFNKESGDATKLEMVECEVTEIDGDGGEFRILTVRFLCEKCNRFYQTSFIY